MEPSAAVAKYLFTLQKHPPVYPGTFRGFTREFSKFFYSSFECSIRQYTGRRWRLSSELVDGGRGTWCILDSTPLIPTRIETFSDGSIASVKMRSTT